MQILFIGSQRRHAFAVFNPNAFPPEVRHLVDACCYRLALVLHHTSLLGSAIERDAADFRQSIESSRADLEAGLRQRPDLTSTAVYDGIGFVSEMHNSLNALKSFFDLYAKLIGKLVNLGNHWSFGKANIDDQKLSGGRLIKALRSASKTGAYADLADLTTEHSVRWITVAVKYRDQLSHRSNLDHMVRMHLPLRAQPPHWKFEELVTPAMPNGVDLKLYFGGLRRELRDYLNASIELVPNVDLSLISPAEFLVGK